MGIEFHFSSTAFHPTPGELNEDHEDYINPGLYALELANFLANELKQRGFPTRFRCQEDWGHWLELEHKGTFTLAVGCSADASETIAGMPQHRVFLEPKTPVIRKLFKKIDVTSDLQHLSTVLMEIFESSPAISNIQRSSDI